MSTNTVTVHLFSNTAVAKNEQEQFSKDIREIIKKKWSEDDDGDELGLEDENIEVYFSEEPMEGRWGMTDVVVTIYSKYFTPVPQCQKLLRARGLKFVDEMIATIEYYMDDSQEVFYWTKDKKILKDLGFTKATFFKVDKNYDKKAEMKYALLGNISEKEKAKLVDEDGDWDDELVDAYLDKHVDDWYFHLDDDFETKFWDSLRTHSNSEFATFEEVDE